MWKKMSYRKKNIILLAGASVLLVIAYMLAFSKTIHLYQTNQQLREKALLAARAPEEIAHLENQLLHLRQSFEPVASDVNLRREILEKLSLFCQQYDVQLKQFEHEDNFSEKALLIATHEVTLEGNYKNLLQVIHALEQDLKAGKIASMSFRLEQNRFTKQKYLLAYLAIQSVKEDAHTVQQ